MYTPGLVPLDTFSLLYGILRSATLVYLIYKFLGWVWKSMFVRSNLHDIPGPPPQSWLKGNLGQLFNPKGLEFHQMLVDTYGGMVKVHGFFGDEQLYVSDPRALQSIVLKDQGAFEETSVFLETNKVIFGPGLVATKGEQHKRQRKMAAPVFSATQLRQIIPTFYDVAEKLVDVLARELEQKGPSDGKSGKGILDMSEWMSRTALESVGRAVLGYSFDPLESAHNNPYTSAIKELIPTIFSLSLVRQFAPFLVRLGPPWFRRKLVEWIPVESVQKLKGMSDVMHEKAQEILEEKRSQMGYQDNDVQGGELKDIISALVRANNSAQAHERLSKDELTGQMTVLIFGAQDTTSSALSRILWQLSLRPDVQSKIRDELRNIQQRRNAASTNFRLTYEDIISLPWLDAVVKETLRLYPPVPFVRRVATRDCSVPYMRGDELVHVTVPSGTILFVGIAGSNRLESVWGPDAKEWRPERWLSDEKDKLPKQKLPGIYSGMMSFLGGGRSCMGCLFAQVEMKVILTTLLARYKFSETKHDIVWNLSQIIAPSVRTKEDGESVIEKKGLPLTVEIIS